MGTLGDVLRRVTGAFGTATPQAGGNPLLNHVLNMINDPGTGGLQGLVDRFHSQGLGGIVNSWVSTGQNQAISPEQITRALGADRVQQAAQASGTPASAVAAQLAALLPTVIDKLTPQGSIPQGSAIAQGLAALRNTLGAAAAPGAPATPTTPQTRSPR
jgi:uncharacterized protein YidB (DUF937 family)